VSASASRDATRCWSPSQSDPGATTEKSGFSEANSPPVQFSSWTGVRSGELQALRHENIRGGTIRVEKARRRDGTEGPPKNGKPRIISFLPPARVLDDLPRRPDPYVFHSPRGYPLDQGSLFYAWREVRATANLREIRWHDLRHFCATQLLELHHFAVSIQLGHTDGGALVMERYGHPSEDAARDRLQRAFKLSAAETGNHAGSSRSPVAHP
jgi:integrase